MINLDTHILVFALEGNLTAKEQTALAGQPWSISSIVLWELAKLIQLDRLELNLDDRPVRHALGSLRVWPIDIRVARTSRELDFRGDPADELIAATSVVNQVPLLTRDRNMRRSKLVPLAA